VLGIALGVLLFVPWLDQGHGAHTRYLDLHKHHSLGLIPQSPFDGWLFYFLPIQATVLTFTGLLLLKVHGTESMAAEVIQRETIANMVFGGIGLFLGLRFCMMELGRGLDFHMGPFLFLTFEFVLVAKMLQLRKEAKNTS